MPCWVTEYVDGFGFSDRRISYQRMPAMPGRASTDWVVTSATQPERAEQPRTAEENAARALGTRKIALKFVLTRLDAMLGSRVAVTGLLMGTGGADGINTTTVNRVAPKCP